MAPERTPEEKLALHRGVPLAAVRQLVHAARRTVEELEGGSPNEACFAGFMQDLFAYDGPGIHLRQLGAADIGASVSLGAVGFRAELARKGIVL